MSTTTNPSSTLTRCGACGAAAAADQRYCLSCGERRADVPDPVSRYLSEAGAARARVAAAVERRAQARRSRRLPRLSPAVATVLVVIALLAGLEIGRSTASSASHSSATRSSLSTSGAKTSSPGSGGSAVDQVAKSKGQSYVQQESKLPTSVSP